MRILKFKKLRHTKATTLIVSIYFVDLQSNYLHFIWLLSLSDLVDMLSSGPGEAAGVVAADHMQRRGVGMASCECAIVIKMSYIGSRGR
jgi:hypothetical protein